MILWIGVAGLGDTVEAGLTELPVFGGGVREDPAEGNRILMRSLDYA